METCLGQGLSLRAVVDVLHGRPKLLELSTASPHPELPTALN